MKKSEMTWMDEPMTDDALDLAIAIEIMGWTIKFPGFPYYAHYCDNSGDFVPDPNKPGNSLAITQWQPTRNITQAWQVINRMEEQGFTFNLSSQTHGDNPRNYMMQFYLAKFTFAGCHESVSRVICQVALYAFREK